MPIQSLVAHIRAWVAGPKPNSFYRRYLDRVRAMSDEQIADVVRFAKTTRGAEMAICRAIHPATTKEI